MRRWIVLGVYSLAAALSQLLWLNFAPILDQIQKRYAVSETWAGMLLMVFPLVYVFLAIPAGAFIDRRGYRAGIGLGTILMAVFACLRIFDQSFWFLLAAQTGIAVSQPFVINGISKLILDWFDREQGAIATGLGTMGMFIGMAVGMAATPPLVETFGFRGAMEFYAVLSVLVSAAFFIFVHPKDSSSAPSEENSISSLSQIFQDRDLVLLFVLSFLGLGFFNGLTTWLELILAPNGINADQAGLIGGVLILGGIVGAAVIPALSDWWGRRKPFLVGSIVVALGTLYPLCTGHFFNVLMVFGAIQGFFFLPAFSLLLEMSAELVGETRAASATGILMLAGNGGGVVVILAMEWVKGDYPTFMRGVHLLAVLLALAAILALFLTETHGKKRQSSIQPA